MVLEGETPRLIDEWQEVEAIWDAVRYAVDQRGERGRFILTGSSTPKKKENRVHSGAGRIGKLRMRKRESEIVGGEPDEGNEPPEKKPRDLER